MADPTELSDGDLIERFTKAIGEIDDDSALSGCAELLEHALPSEGERTWTRQQLLAFFVELTGLLVRARVGLTIDEVGEVEDDEAAGSELRYYHGHAMHSRAGEVRKQFTGSINMVRVPLPRAQPSEKFAIQTKIGRVLAGDHGIPSDAEFKSVFSIERINALYRREAQQGGWQSDLVAEQVDLITGARADNLIGSRFTPVSLFLAYAAGEPIFHVVQSGFFNGNPSKLYVARDMTDTIIVQGGYKPTPFAHPLNFYRITLTMAGDEPQRLHGKMRENMAPDDLTVTLDFERLAGPPRSNSPLRAQVIAFSRVCAIEDWMGRSHPRRPERPRDMLEAVLHQLGLRFGKLLPWR